LGQPFWGQGFATEAGQAGLRYGFDELGVESIVGIVHPENKASQRVLEKLGLRLTQRTQYFGMDCYRYAIERSSYDRAKEGPMFSTEQAIGAWVDMWNSYDLSQIDELFLRDANLTYFSSEKEGVIKGIEAVREHHRGFGFVEGGKASENKLWVEDLHTTDFGPAVIVTGVWHFRRGSGQVQRGPVTFVYVQKGDGYRLAHLNFGNYR
jgi:ketosteroid isomerase-like protein